MPSSHTATALPRLFHGSATALPRRLARRPCIATPRPVAAFSLSGAAAEARQPPAPQPPAPASRPSAPGRSSIVCSRAVRNAGREQSGPTAGRPHSTELRVSPRRLARGRRAAYRAHIQVQTLQNQKSPPRKVVGKKIVLDLNFAFNSPAARHDRHLPAAVAWTEMALRVNTDRRDCGSTRGPRRAAHRAKDERRRDLNLQAARSAYRHTDPPHDASEPSASGSPIAPGI